MIAITEILLIRQSFKGSIVDNNARTMYITELLGIRVYLLICQVVFIILGIICIIESFKYELYSEVSGYHYLFLLTTLALFYHMIDICGLINFYLVFSFPLTSLTSNHVDRNQSVELWKVRCSKTCNLLKIITCNIFGGNNINEDLEAVAHVLTDLFHHDGLLDVVFTDIVAGIILVKLQQEKYFNNSLMQSEVDYIDLESNNPLFGEKVDIGIENIDDVEENKQKSQRLLNTLSRYCVYSCSIYSYMLQLYVRKAVICMDIHVVYLSSF